MAGERVFPVVDSPTSQIIAHVQIEVVDQAVRQKIGFFLLQPYIVRDGGNLEVAVVIGFATVKDHGIPNPDFHSVAKRDEVVLLFVQVCAVTVSPDVVLGECHVPDQPLRSGQEILVIQSDVRPILDFAVVLCRHVAGNPQKEQTKEYEFYPAHG